MIKSIRLQNFRSFVDSKWIDLSPLTIAVGKNSAGKSSFLRMFPLLKQSLEEDTKEPLLWYGRFVDFGRFSDVLSRTASEQSLTIGFKIVSVPTGGLRETTLTDDGEPVFFYIEDRPVELFLKQGIQLVAGLTLEKKPDGDGTYISRITLDVLQDHIEIRGNEFGEVVAVVLGDEIVEDFGKIQLRTVRGAFFPSLISINADLSRMETLQSRRDGALFSCIAAKLDWLFHGNTKVQTKRNVLRRLKWGAGRDFYDHLISLAPNAEAKLPWPEKSRSVPAGVSQIRRLVLLKQLPRILGQFNAELSKTANAVKYLAPVRATASRYYRFQELAVDQIDQQGENVPMFLNSLPESQRHHLEKWMADSLGFTIRSSRSGGHTALMISERADDSELNLADTGFGYSQILPVALQIWKSLQDVKKAHAMRSDKSSLLVIEQPELHLHPQFQAALADVFASAIGAHGTDGAGGVSFLIETHSEHLINRLGQLVERGVLKTEDVQIVLFEKDPASGSTGVRLARFGEDGVLQGDWPFGFFIPQLP